RGRRRRVRIRRGRGRSSRRCASRRTRCTLEVDFEIADLEVEFAPLLGRLDELDDLQQVLVGQLLVTHRACAPPTSRSVRYRPKSPTFNAVVIVWPPSNGISRDGGPAATARRGGTGRRARA